jgi:hypothetical protein
VERRAWRDGGFDRFLGGIEHNLEAAVTADLINQDEFGRIWEAFQESLAAIGERGTRRGDRLLQDVTFNSDGWARGIKGLFLGPNSRFSKKLVGSLWDS